MGLAAASSSPTDRNEPQFERTHALHPRVPVVARSASSHFLLSRRVALITGIAFILIAILLAGAIFIEGAVRWLPGVAIGVAVCAAAIAVATAMAMRHTMIRTPLSSYWIAGIGLVSVGLIAQIISDPRDVSMSLLAASPAITGAYLIFTALALRLGALVRVGGPFAFFSDAALPPPAVLAGTKVALQAGQIVPTDVRLEHGSCAILERFLSPVGAFRVRDEGEVLFGGSKIIGGEGEGIALVDSEQCCLRRLERLSENHLRRSDEALRASDEPLMGAIGMIAALAAVLLTLWRTQIGAPVGELLTGAGLILSAGALGTVRQLLYLGRLLFVQRWARGGLLLARFGAIEELGRISRVVLDPAQLSEESLYRVISFELLDDRVSRQALCASIASLLGRAEDKLLLSAGDFCRSVAGTLSPERVLDLREYDGKGISGSLKGVEMSIGFEDFLVDRGILLQPTDAIPAKPGERTLLIAIDDDLIGRMRIRTGQEHLLIEGEKGPWTPDIRITEWPVPVVELHEEVLLVRGSEVPPEVSCRHQCATYLGEKFELPETTIVALTLRLRHLPALLRGCREESRLATTSRTLLLVSLFTSILVVAVGILTPFVVAGIAIGVSVWISMRQKDISAIRAEL